MGERKAAHHLPVAGVQRQLTPSQPKFDITKKDRIARMH
jgi:hypothetical protein